MDLSFLALLLCPLMLIFMFFIMRGMHSNKNNSEQSINTSDLQRKLSKVMEQNEKLAKEIESMKRYR